MDALNLNFHDSVETEPREARFAGAARAVNHSTEKGSTKVKLCSIDWTLPD